MRRNATRRGSNARIAGSAAGAATGVPAVLLGPAAPAGAGAAGGTAVTVGSATVGVMTSGLLVFLPASGWLGFQSLFFLASAASVSAPLGCGLFTNGLGTLVTYTATASAAPKPINPPIITPSMVPPNWSWRCLFGNFIVCIVFCKPYILRGALTPSTASPLCNTCAQAATSAKRADFTASSSTKIRSAS